MRQIFCKWDASESSVKTLTYFNVLSDKEWLKCRTLKKANGRNREQRNWNIEQICARVVGLEINSDRVTVETKRKKTLFPASQLIHICNFAYEFNDTDGYRTPNEA